MKRCKKGECVVGVFAYRDVRLSNPNPVEISFVKESECVGAPIHIQYRFDHCPNCGHKISKLAERGKR